MRHVLLPLILLFSTFTTSAFSDDDVKAVVHKWNELHNTHNLQVLSGLYSSEILFYGKNYTLQKCLAVKEKLLREGFQQEIISPITISYFSSGTIKCDFTKRNRVQKTVKEHLCYLLLKEIDGELKVTGESDLMSDERRNVHLDLGSKQINPQTKNYLLIGCLMLFAPFGYYWWKQKKTKHTREGLAEITTYHATPELAAKDEELKKLEADNLALIARVKEAVREELKNMTPTENLEKQKGNAFENFIVKKFDLTVFKLMEWRSDKYHEGRYAQTNHYPDMEWELNLAFAKKATFAVECKYRSVYYENGIKICEPYQLNNYRDYAHKHQVPVYILLGVGGEPAAPAELFIIPLQYMNNNYMSERELSTLKKRKTDGTFFYDSQTNQLS